MSTLADEFETPNFFVRHYKYDPHRIVVSFASLGYSGRGYAVEEFRRSFENIGVSAIYVTDRTGLWWNHDETLEVFSKIAKMCCGYKNVVAVGDSMGGCGALAFSNFCNGVTRLLAFSPQYSIAQPFIEFDCRYKSRVQNLQHLVFKTYGSIPKYVDSLLIYGNSSWEDYIHQSMFSEYEHTLLNIEGSGHAVARFLKDKPNNTLLLILENPCNFGHNSWIQSIKSLLKTSVSKTMLKPDFKRVWQEGENETPYTPLLLPVPIGLANVALYKNCVQSSIFSAYQGRLGSANNGRVSGSFGFHTNCEQGAWWFVDLESLTKIVEIRIYNRVESSQVSERFSDFSVQCSTEEAGPYYDIYRQKEGEGSGVYGLPMIVRPQITIECRFLRIIMHRQEFLHLDEIQVLAIE